MYICDNWHVLYVLVECWRPADSQLKCTIGTNCHICTLLPPDDGLLASPNHVEVLLLNELKINGASSWFRYMQI
jgi:hypothetical protein